MTKTKFAIFAGGLLVFSEIGYLLGEMNGLVSALIAYLFGYMIAHI
jgi:hypothetical protein